MNNEELKLKLTAQFPAATFEDGGEWVNMFLEPASLISSSLELNNHPDFHFDYLFCLTCVDWKTHFNMVYHLTSTKHRHAMVLKVKLDRNKPEIETVCNIWRTAEFHEREVYELFGVNFLNHPDPRLLILPDGWEGKNPMRKDFEDPINMIKL